MDKQVKLNIEEVSINGKLKKTVETCPDQLKDASI